MAGSVTASGRLPDWCDMRETDLSSLLGAGQDWLAVTLPDFSDFDWGMRPYCMWRRRWRQVTASVIGTNQLKYTLLGLPYPKPVPSLCSVFSKHLHKRRWCARSALRASRIVCAMGCRRAAAWALVHHPLLLVAASAVQILVFMQAPCKHLPLSKANSDA